MKVEIPDKICPHCGGTTWSKEKNGKQIRYLCYVKSLQKLRERRARIKEDPIRLEHYRKYAREYARKHPEFKEKYKKYYKENREKVLNRTRAYSRLPKVKAIRNKQARDKVASLKKSALLRYLRKLGIPDPTSVQLKRSHTYLKTIRKWKEIQKSAA